MIHEWEDITDSINGRQLRYGQSWYACRRCLETVVANNDRDAERQAPPCSAIVEGARDWWECDEGDPGTPAPPNVEFIDGAYITHFELRMPESFEPRTSFILECE